MTDAFPVASALVLGAGRSGRAAAALLERSGARVRLLDGDDDFPGGEWDLCVTSPGIPLSHRWQAAARSRGIRVVSELQLGAERWRGRMLAVTGSKGKSSVVKLVADTLARSGAYAVPCGNYGVPLCEVVLDFAGRAAAAAWAVVEVSSFQMETTDAFHPAAAALLNLQEDHLDRHGSASVYHALKLKLLAGAAVAVVPPELRDAAPGAVCAEGGVELLRGSYFDNEVLRGNGLCAIALLRSAGLDDQSIAEGFRAFSPLPHRMQVVHEAGGVRWIDDSKATSLAALAAGVRMASAQCGEGGLPRGVRLIAGGLPKGDSPESVIPCLQSGVKKVYLIGRAAGRFMSAWRSVVPCEECGTLEAAVSNARRDARAGESVVLSPGAASFDQFESFEERGDRFSVLAKEEKEK